MRLPLATLAAVAAAGLGCSSPRPASCPGTPVATFHFTGALVPQGDPSVDALDPERGYLDCTPDPQDVTAPIRYPAALPAFDATLAADDATSSAALCRSNGVVLVGTRTGGTSYSVEADADPAVLCASACGATLRAVVAGEVVPGTGGAPDTFRGALVEVLTAARGACDACLPVVPATSPPEHACAARYALEGAAR